jgi:hypothetical protein
MRVICPEDAPAPAAVAAAVARMLGADRVSTEKDAVAAAGEPDVAAIAISADAGTALRLSQAVRKPVVVVAPGVRTARIHRLLVPLDGSREGSAAIADVLRTATDVELVLAHVHRRDAVPPFEDQPAHESAAWTREFARRWAPGRVDPRVVIRVGRPGRRLVEAVQESRADLVVLSWGGDLRRGRAVVVRRLLADAGVPVLLIRAAPRPSAVDHRCARGHPGVASRP